VFEMLGSWSLGDYPGSQGLRWGHELITCWFGIGPGLLHAIVFGGSGQAGPDTGLQETYTNWSAHPDLAVGCRRRARIGAAGPSGAARKRPACRITLPAGLADRAGVVVRIGQGGQPGCGGRVERREGVDAGGGEVVHLLGLHVRNPQPEPVRSEHGLDVAAVRVGFAGVAQVDGLALNADGRLFAPVTRDGHAVQDYVRESLTPGPHADTASERHQRLWGAAAAVLGQQHLRGELGQFPGDIKRGTIGDHTEPSSRRSCGETSSTGAPRPALGSPVRPRVRLDPPDREVKAPLSEPISLRSLQWLPRFAQVAESRW
jgi:hypothetical protein